MYRCGATNISLVCFFEDMTTHLKCCVAQISLYLKVELKVPRLRDVDVESMRESKRKIMYIENLGWCESKE